MPSDKKQNKKNQKKQNLKTSVNLHACNIKKIIKRGEENVLKVFIIQFYLQTTIYILIAKFDGRYLFHMIIHSL